MKKIKKFKISKVYDLQNSSRTTFYKKILFPNSNSSTWSSSETTLPENQTKEEFDKLPVLERFDHQLKKTGINTKNTMVPNFSWACDNISSLKSEYKLNRYIVLFPFCSAHLPQKKWPYFDKLITLIKDKYNHEISIVIAPGSNELDAARKIDAKCILDNNKALNISQLAALINDSIFVVANDTGPAHIAAHLNVNGISLFGSHTTAHKVSIERENFRAIQVSDLAKLSAEKVFEKLCNLIT